VIPSLLGPNILLRTLSLPPSVSAGSGVLTAMVMKRSNCHLLSWRWRRRVPLKRPLTFNGLHDKTSRLVLLITPRHRPHRK
jgi:hypothetical protein